MSKIPIGLQLYSVRHDCEKDLPGTLSRVAELGYDGVEFAGYYGRSAEELKAMLDQAGLVCCGTHAQWGTMQPDQIQETIAFNKVLGNRYLVVPSMPAERRESRAGWLQNAEALNAIAETLAPHRMLTGYHNHGVEFVPLQGEEPWDTLFSNTGPGVIMQIDTGNARSGGGDPLLYLERYPGRAITVHLKPYSKSNPQAVIGEDEEDWGRVFELCESAGKTEWYIVEYEVPGVPALETVGRCLQGLKAMGK